jgi:limonene-1,2-epoxide hydrolase
MTANDQSALNRRAFIGAGAALLAWPAGTAAAEWTEQEKANVKAVNDMCAAWVAPLDLNKIGGFLAEDCVYRATETTPAVKGRQAIQEALKKMLGSPDKVEFEVVQTFARGPMVVNERFDRFTLPGRSINWHGIGVFFMKNGQIAEWSDFTIAMK